MNSILLSFMVLGILGLDCYAISTNLPMKDFGDFLRALLGVVLGAILITAFLLLFISGALNY